MKIQIFWGYALQIKLRSKIFSKSKFCFLDLPFIVLDKKQKKLMSKDFRENKMELAENF